MCTTHRICRHSQIVDDADIVITVFDSRLGIETRGAASGTAYEIERTIRRGQAGPCLLLRRADQPWRDPGEPTPLNEFRKRDRGQGFAGYPIRRTSDSQCAMPLVAGNSSRTDPVQPHTTMMAAAAPGNDWTVKDLHAGRLAPTDRRSSVVERWRALRDEGDDVLLLVAVMTLWGSRILLDCADVEPVHQRLQHRPCMDNQRCNHG
jgi:hypothetical protein